MLAIAQAKVPPELQQHLELTQASTKPLALYEFTGGKEAEPTTKFLTYPSGLPTKFQAQFYENELVVTDIYNQATKYIHHFDIGTVIVAVEYLQTADGQFGLAVLYNDQKSCCLARLVHAGPRLKLVNETAMNYPGSCLKVVIDDVEMPHSKGKIHDLMQDWQNVVVVGTHFGHAYVFPLPNNPTWTPEKRPEERRLTDALASLHKKVDGVPVIIYSDQRQNVKKQPSEVCVSSIAYISRSCDILLGLSFGGIMQIGITSSGDIVTNVFQSTAPVCHIVPILPHDDPNMSVWFWAFHGKRGHGLTMVLYEGQYDRQASKDEVPSSNKEFRKARFFPRMADQVVARGSPGEWIAAHALTRERRSESNLGGRMDDTTSTPQNMTLNDTDLDISQMFFCYEDACGYLKFGIFDLNTYYYKRLQDRPHPDNTMAKQCPYMINVAGPSLKTLAELGDITDIMVDCSHLKRFQFMEDPEQQLYVSGLSLNKIYLGCSKAGATLQLDSLPGQVLESICDNLEACVHHPRDAAIRLLSVGLVLPPLELNYSASLSLMNKKNSFELLMTAAVLYGYSYSIVDLIAKKKNTDCAELRSISDWMWAQVKQARCKLDSLGEVLFSDNAKELSCEQKRQFRQMSRILKSARAVFRGICDKFKEWEDLDIVPRAVVRESEDRLTGVHNLSDFAFCCRNLYHMKYLPLGERNAEERHSLEESVSKRRAALSALSPPRPLLIDKVIKNMQLTEPQEPFWLEQDAQMWYPPALHNAITPLLILTFHQRMKQDFIIYYTIDLVAAKKRLANDHSNQNDYAGLMFYAKEILYDVLDIGEKEITDVLNAWIIEEEIVLGHDHRITVPSIRNRNVQEDLEQEVAKLASRSQKLSPEDEQHLQSLCNKMPYGQFRYQLYLLERSRFLEVQILAVPSRVGNKYVDLYAQALPAIRQIKQSLQPLQLQNLPKWSDDVLKKISEYNPTQYKPAPNQAAAAVKTPMALFKRIGRSREQLEKRETTQEPEIITSPEAHLAEAPSMDTTPVMNEMDAAAKERMSAILRTPTSRRARAAAAAEGQTGVAVTPESLATLPAPTSILKTPIRKTSTMSPSRGRLHWDPEFPFKASVGDSASVLNFDDSDEKTSLGQDIETSSAGETANSMERTIEVQPDEEEEVVAVKAVSFPNDVTYTIVEKEEQEEEAEPEPLVDTECSAIDTVKLVDYSLTESTFAETPKRQPSRHVLSTSWTDENGILHSFEEQQDDQEDEPSIEEECTPIEKRAETAETARPDVPEVPAEELPVVDETAVTVDQPKTLPKKDSPEKVAVEIVKVDETLPASEEPVVIVEESTGPKRRLRPRKEDASGELSAIEIFRAERAKRSAPSLKRASSETAAATPAKRSTAKTSVEKEDPSEAKSSRSSSRRRAASTSANLPPASMTQRSPSRARKSTTSTSKDAIAVIPTRSEVKSSRSATRTRAASADLPPAPETRRSPSRSCKVPTIIPEEATVPTTPTRSEAKGTRSPSRRRAASTSADLPPASMTQRSPSRARKVTKSLSEDAVPNIPPGSDTKSSRSTTRMRAASADLPSAVETRRSPSRSRKIPATIPEEEAVPTTPRRSARRNI